MPADEDYTKNQHKGSRIIDEFKQKVNVKLGEIWENFWVFVIGSEKVIIPPLILLGLSFYMCS